MRKIETVSFLTSRSVPERLTASFVHPGCNSTAALWRSTLTWLLFIIQGGTPVTIVNLVALCCVLCVSRGCTPVVKVVTVTGSTPPGEKWLGIPGLCLSPSRSVSLSLSLCFKPLLCWREHLPCRQLSAPLKTASGFASVYSKQRNVCKGSWRSHLEQ